MGDVHRAKLKILQGSNGEDGANGGISDSGSKGLLEIEARALRIALGDQSSLVAFQGAICIIFHLQEPSGANGMLPSRQFDDLPGAIDLMSLHLLLTSFVP